MIYANRKKTQNSKPKQTHTKTKSKSKPKCKFKNCLRVCSHCACNTAPNCSDYFTSWPPDYHHHLDAVCWSLLEGVTMKAWAPRKRSGHAAPGDFLNLSSKIKMELKKCEWNSRKRGGGCARRWVECISPILRGSVVGRWCWYRWVLCLCVFTRGARVHCVSVILCSHACQHRVIVIRYILLIGVRAPGRPGHAISTAAAGNTLSRD